MGVSQNSSTPKSSFSIGFSIINHPFWGNPIFGNIHICIQIYIYKHIQSCVQAHEIYQTVEKESGCLKSIQLVDSLMMQKSRMMTSWIPCNHSEINYLSIGCNSCFISAIYWRLVYIVKFQKWILACSVFCCLMFIQMWTCEEKRNWVFMSLDSRSRIDVQFWTNFEVYLDNKLQQIRLCLVVLHKTPSPSMMIPQIEWYEISPVTVQMMLCESTERLVWVLRK